MNTPFQSHGDEPMAGPTSTTMYHVVYCSRASADVDDADVARIIESARRHNPARGITGLLVFGAGIFFQWLEGPRDNIEQLLVALRADARHNTIVLLSAVEEVRERLFPDWDMERVTGDDIRDVLEDALDTAEDPANTQALKVLLSELDAGQLRSLRAA